LDDCTAVKFHHVKNTQSSSKCDQGRCKTAVGYLHFLQIKQQNKEKSYWQNFSGLKKLKAEYGAF